MKKGTKEFKDNPFFVINPDTLWSNKYSEEIQSLEKEYFLNKQQHWLLCSSTTQLSLKHQIHGIKVLQNWIYTLKNKLDILNQKLDSSSVFRGLYDFFAVRR